MTGAKNVAATVALTAVVALCCTATAESTADHQTIPTSTSDVTKLVDIIDRLFDAADTYQLAPGVRVKRSTDGGARSADHVTTADRLDDPERYLYDRIAQFASTHILDVNFSELIRSTGRTLPSMVHIPRLNFGKNSFLTGFGLGFLAFGLKKLLLPIIIGAQILKSIAFAALLPTLLGSVGKVVSKGVSNFASSSSHFHPIGSSDGLNDFEFNNQQPNYGLGYDTAAAADTSGSETGYQSIWTYPPDNSANAISTSYSNSRYPVKYGQNSMSSTKLQSGNYYTKDKTEDFKNFHAIPASSHLLAHYDPFYSPLLSRIDTVFKQLGYTTEPCRERLVCQMYKNPAKFAPYSNLVSAQLSRELNELRKPSSENPEILRFFKYMKAAKDGQDNQECDYVFSACVSPRSPDDSVPMMTTFNEINKLVQARHAKQVTKSSANVDVTATDAVGNSEPITKSESNTDPESIVTPESATKSESVIRPESNAKQESASMSAPETKPESNTELESTKSK